jgi:hypothetical protein
MDVSPGNAKTTMEQLTKRPRTEPEEHLILPLAHIEHLLLV